MAVVPDERAVATRAQRQHHAWTATPPRRTPADRSRLIDPGAPVGHSETFSVGDARGLVATLTGPAAPEIAGSTARRDAPRP